MAIQDFYYWTVNEGWYDGTLVVNSTSRVTLTDRNNSYSPSTRIYREYANNYFKDYKLNFDLTVTDYDDYSSSGIFAINGSEGYYQALAVTLRMQGGNATFRVIYSQYYHYEYQDIVIPLTSLPLHYYFYIEKSNDTFNVEIHYTTNRNDPLGSASITYYAISNFDESTVTFFSGNAKEQTDPNERFITLVVENFDILETSSSSSSSYSSSSRSSSSSSSLSVNPMAVINDIGIAGGSSSSSSSSFSISPCEVPDLETDWEPENLSGTPGATWNATDHRWESIHYGINSYLGLDPVNTLINQVCDNRLNNTDWQANNGMYGTWNSGSNRWEAYNGGSFFYLDLDPIGGWNTGYYPLICRFTIEWVGASSDTMSVSVSGGSYDGVCTNGVEIELLLSGTNQLTDISFFANRMFYLTSLTFCTATRSGWNINYSPNEMKFTPYLVGTSNATFTYVMVQLDNNQYVSSYDPVPVVSGVTTSIPLSLFFAPRRIVNVFFSISGNGVDYQDYGIEELYFCGSASSSSRSSSSSSRSSSSSSSSNGTEWDFFTRTPLTATGIQENGPIRSFTNNHQFKDNTLRTVNVYDSFMYYQEYKDGQWTPQEMIYSGETDVVNYAMKVETSPDYALFDYNSRPAIALKWGAPNSQYITQHHIDFNYKDINGVWQRESDVAATSPNPDLAYYNSNGAAVFSSDATYMAVNSGSNYPYLVIHKRTGDSFAKLTVNAPDTMPTSSNYVTCLMFSPDDNYLACGMSASPYLWIYKRTGDTFIKLASPLSANPASSVSEIHWSSDSLNLAVGHSSSPRITMYQRSGDTFTKATNPTTLPAATPMQILYSPDTNYLAVSCSSSPYFYMYSRSGNTYTKLADLVDALPSQYYMTWAADSSYMVFVRNVFSYEEHIVVYTNSSGVLTKQNTAYATLFDVKPRAGTYNYVKSAKITPDGQLLICCMEQQPHLAVYQISAGPIFTLVPNLNDLFVTGGGPSDDRLYNISGNSQYLSLTYFNQVYVYKRNGTAFSLISDQGGISPTANILDFVFAKQAPNGDVHLIVNEGFYFYHIVRNNSNGVWTRNFISEVMKIGFWEGTPDINNYKAKCKMDSNGYLHLVYFKLYYQMPTTGSSPQQYLKVMYATNRTGSWVKSEIHNFAYSSPNTLYPALDIDTNGTVFVLTTNQSNTTGVFSKLEVGGSWTSNVINDWDSNWGGCEGHVYNGKFYALSYYRFIVLDTTTMEMLYNYNLSSIQTDPYPAGTYNLVNYRDLWENVNGQDLRMKMVEAYPYAYQKIYKIPLEYSSSSRSSSSRSSSSSSSSSLAEPDDTWSHNLTSGLNSYTTPYDIIKDPNSNAIHAFVTSRWYRKDDVTNDDVWVIDDNAGTLSHSASQSNVKMYISPTTNMRYVAYYASNQIYLRTRAQGATIWGTTIIQLSTMYSYGCIDLAEDSNGYLHIMYSQDISGGSVGGATPYITKVRHATNASGSWAVEDTAFIISTNLSDAHKIYGLAMQILPGNVIHCAGICRRYGAFHLYGTTGSWNYSPIFLEPEYNSLGEACVNLLKDSSNNLHFLTSCRYGHYTGSYSVDYGFYNGVSWTLESIPGYTFNSYLIKKPTLIIDQSDIPHFITNNGSNYLVEWKKVNGEWKYICRESYPITDNNIVGCYSNGYMNVISRSSTNVVMYSKKSTT